MVISLDTVKSLIFVGSKFPWILFAERSTKLQPLRKQRVELKRSLVNLDQRIKVHTKGVFNGQPHKFYALK